MTGNSRSAIYSYDFKLSPFYTNSGEDIKRLLCINTFSTGIYNSALTLLAYSPKPMEIFEFRPALLVRVLAINCILSAPVLKSGYLIIHISTDIS